MDNLDLWSAIKILTSEFVV